jgi:excisionase family DNA binding protein
MMDMLTVKQAAERLRVSVATVYQLCATRRLAHVRLGLGRGTIRIREDDLTAFLAGAAVRTPESARPPPRPRTLKHLTAPPAGSP